HGLVVLRNLLEDPRVRRGGATDHDGVASGLRDHGCRVLGSADVAVADHGNLDCLLHRGDPLPTCVAAVSLLASARVQSDCLQSAIFRELSEFDADDLIIVPTEAELHREWDGDYLAD